MDSGYAVREFVGGVLCAAKEEWKRAQSGKEIDQQFASIAFLEAYGWLRIGVQVGRFQRELANEFITPIVESLQQATEMADKQSLLDSGLIAQSLRLLKAKDHSPPSFSKQFPSEFQHLPEAPTLFSLWSTEAQAFSESLNGTKLAKTLTFANDQNWKIAVTGLRDEPFVSDPKGEGPDASLFEGYFRALQHLHRIADLLTVEGVRTEQWPARAILRVEIARVHAWRLSFRAGAFGPRFDAATDVVAHRLSAEAAAEGTKLPRHDFIEAVAQLKRRYTSVLGYLVRGAEH
jgi:hypothetical protein